MTSPSTDGHRSPTDSSAYFTFTLLFLLYMFDYIDRLVISSLFPFLKQDWGLTDTHCGLLISAVYWSILVFSLPASILVDRWSRKKSIGIMSLMWGLACIACAFTRNFTQLFAARSLIGIGEAGYAPGGTAMISALFPQERRARMLGLWNASIPLGGALGVAMGGVIAQHLGWRHAFGIVAIPGLIVALLFFKVKDYRTIALLRDRGNGTNGNMARMGVPEIVLRFIRNRTLMANNFAFAGNTFVTAALLTWLPSYFNRLEGLSMDKAGPKSAIVMLMAIVGAPLGGYLADRWQQKRNTARLLFPSLSSLITAVLLLIAFTSLRGTLQYGVLLLAGMSIIAFVPASVAVTQDVVHPGLRAISLSLCVIVQHLFGSALGPPFIGVLSDRYGLETAMQFLALFAFLSGILYFIGSFSYPKDAAGVEPVEIVME
ncbi:MAG: MFS transporter [Deltaproteobacteria bacterium]|nr:MFS transporter [Deltaproteobacteria bacterium]